MTTEQKIAMLRHMMEDDTTEAVILETFLELAGQAILNRMYQFQEPQDDAQVPDKYVAIQLKVACYMLNKRGAEGEVQHIENGIHRNYGSSDIPDSMLKDITPYARVIR